MKKIIVLLILVGAIIYGMLNYHLILMDKEVKFLKKADLTPEYTFVDARGAGRAKLFLNPALVRADIKSVINEVEKK